MQNHLLPASFALCLAAVSCTTTPPDHSLVSTAWLDTPPRRAEYLPRQESGLTHWTASLPPARVQDARSAPDPAPSPPGSTAEAPSRDTPRHGYADYPGYLVHARPVLRIPRRHAHHGKDSPGDRPRERTVEKVGPPMVPRADVPLIDLSLGAATRHSHHGGVRYDRRLCPVR